VREAPDGLPGDSLLLPSVAVAVLGGASLTRGRGFPISTAIAAFFGRESSRYDSEAPARAWERNGGEADMTEQLTVVAHLRALNGQIEETKKFLMALIGPTRAEPGCVEYWLHQDNDDPAEFTFYENWTNRPEWDKHMEMPHLQKFAEVKDKVFELQKLRLMTMISDSISKR
jgi:quinol monooxygenase YgiN